MKRILIGMALLLAAHGRAAEESLLQRMEQEVTTIVERALPAVVTVRAERPVNFLNADVQRQQLTVNVKRAAPLAGRTQGTGTGFILSPDGYIATSLDVVSGADAAEILLADRRQLAGRVVGRDSLTNLALVKVDAAGLPVLPLGDSDAVKPGAWAITIGSPLGLQNSVALGVVAGRDRWVSNSGGAQNLLQISGGVAPGASGAPVLNARGEAVGIITAGMPALETNNGLMQQRANPQQSNAWAQVQTDVSNNASFANAPLAVTGSGFALPINIARRVIEDLKAGRATRAAYLGVQAEPGIGIASGQQAVRGGRQSAPGANVQPLSGGGQQAFVPPGGVVLSEVIAGSPAAQAGLKKGDVLLLFAGRGLNSSDDLYRAVLERRPGESVPVTYLRANQRATLTIRLGEMPAQAQQQIGSNLGQSAAAPPPAGRAGQQAPRGPGRPGAHR